MNFYGKAQNVGESVIDAFKNGTVPAALANVFLSVKGRHAAGYSWFNQMLVALAGHTDAMGYGSDKHNSGWTSVGRQVRKGEKCFYILSPCTRRIADVKAPDGKRTIVTGFRASAVFGISQTDIADEAKWAKHSSANESAETTIAELPLLDVAKSWGLTVTAFDGKRSNAAGWYAPNGGNAIGIGVENLSTWAHELMHAADDRLDNLTESGQHWRSETVAELGGAILLTMLGYETDADLGGAYKYITKYAETAGIDVVKASMKMLKRTCDAVALILAEADELGQGLSLEDMSDDANQTVTGGVTVEGQMVA